MPARDASTVADDQSEHLDDASPSVAVPSTSPGPQAAPQAPPQAAPRSPAEAFADLADGVGRLQREVGMIGDFVRGTGAQFQRSADELRFAGSEAAVSGLIRIHDLLYRQKRDLRDDVETAVAIRTTKILLDAVEGELAAVDVRVIEPNVDDDVDLRLMLTVGNRPTPAIRSSKRGVAIVLSCAYVNRSSVGDRILKKSEVVVWRGRRDIAIDITNEPDHEGDNIAPELTHTLGQKPTLAPPPQRHRLSNLLSRMYRLRSSFGDRDLKQSEAVSRGPRDIALDMNDGVNHEEAAGSWDRSGDDVLGGGGPESCGSSGDRPEQ